MKSKSEIYWEWKAKPTPSQIFIATWVSYLKIEKSHSFEITDFLDITNRKICPYGPSLPRHGHYPRHGSLEVKY